MTVILAVQTFNDTAELALGADGSQLLQRAAETSRLDIFCVVLKAVASATHTAAPMAARSAAAMSAGQQKVALALMAEAEGGSEFLSAVHNSPLCPSLMDWFDTLVSQATVGNIKQALACMKGLAVLSPTAPVAAGHCGKPIDSAILQHFSMQYSILKLPVSILHAFIASWALDVQQRKAALAAAETALQESQAHRFAQLAMLKSSVVELQTQLDAKQQQQKQQGRPICAAELAATPGSLQQDGHGLKRRRV